MNSSFTLDGGPSSAFAYQWDTRCWSFNCLTGCYNTSVYNTQSLTYAAHTLNITMLSYPGPNTWNNGYSDFWFDYAVVSSPGHLGSSSQPSHKSLAVAIGGAVGGIAAVISFLLAILCWKRNWHWRRRPHLEVDPEPTESPFQPTTFITNPPRQVDALHLSSPRSLLPRDINLQTDDILPPHMPPKSGLPSATAHGQTSSVAATETRQQSSSSQTPTLAEADNVGRTFFTSPRATMLTATSPSINAYLTDEQSELVQGLLRHNVPLPTVVHTIEGMLRREGELGNRETDNPPDYEYI